VLKEKEEIEKKGERREKEEDKERREIELLVDRAHTLETILSFSSGSRTAATESLARASRGRYEL
jgi:hypothetical protein